MMKLRGMKRWKKVVLVLLGLVVLAQVPFIYRRLRLRRLSIAINELNSQRVADQAETGYRDYKGVIHVHSLLGGHSTGTLTDIVEAADSNGLDFVVMTEHPSKYIDTSEMTLKGVHGKALFINGSEINTTNNERFLLMPGAAPATSGAPFSTPEVLAQKKAQGSLAFAAYPKEFRSWDSPDYDGIEVYNMYTNARRISPLLTFFDGLWSYWSYPDLLFTTFYERPGESLQKWDDLLRAANGNRKLVAIAGNDAHANIGFSLLVDGAGKKFLQVKLDPYERSFRVVRNHVLVEKTQPLGTESLLSAISSGHCYISFDLLCDGTGFSFVAENRSEKKIMGDEINLEDGVRFTVVTPVPSRIQLIKDGKVVQEKEGATKQEFLVDQKGVYRVETYLPRLGDSFKDKPWIISNPIYVR